MSPRPERESTDWRFHKFALFVTGEGERKHLPKLFRSLEAEGRCHFQVVHKIDQLSPVRSKARRLKMVGQGKTIPTKDEELGLKARECLNDGYAFLLLIDDLEHDRQGQAEGVFTRYREALDVMLRPKGLESRASVHFLVNMLEAYYFADAAAVNRVLGTNLDDFDGDVETIRHPKNELKFRVKALGGDRNFDEVKDGGAIRGALDMEKVLSRSETCRSLRTMFAWCRRAMGESATERFQLAHGETSPITGGQLGRLPPASG